ncbi:hypothetical protein LTS18_009126, partial [Coniosporium uncinatum]
MDQQGQTGPMGPQGRRLHIAHRRSPSELTPLMMEQLALAQQIELLQQQQQQVAATHQQYINMGIIQPQQHLPNAGYQLQGQMQNMSPHTNQFQFPQQMQQQQHLMPMAPPQQPSTHRRNQSALPGMGSMGPPPAPSAGASGLNLNDMSSQQGQGRENVNPRGRGGGAAGSGHARRHSLALPEAKKAAELAEQKRKTAGFQFPVPGSAGADLPQSATSPSPTSGPPAQLAPTTPSSSSTRGGPANRGHGRSQSMAVGNGRGSSQGRGNGGAFQFPPPQATNDASAGNTGSDFQRRGSQGHGRTGSRNFEGNWRQQGNQPQEQQAQQQQQQQSSMGNFQNPNAAPFQPGHRARGSINQSVGSLGNFQYQAQPQLVQLPQGQVMVQPQMFMGQQGINPLQLAQLQALQAAQMSGQSMPGLQSSQHAQPQMSMQQQQQQQRKTLFTPYLPQATLPALLGDGQLVAGILRVNKKNRSDAYVTTTDLDADIFICGSKDRNRALEGDLVAIELLDVDEVWGQKREKEEKKKRKDNTDNRGGSIAVNDATT